MLLRRGNSCRDRGEHDEPIGDSKRGDLKDNCYKSVEAVKKDEGDGWSGCRYIISDHNTRRNIAISDMIYLSTLDTRTLNGAPAWLYSPDRLKELSMVSPASESLYRA